MSDARSNPGPHRGSPDCVSTGSNSETGKILIVAETIKDETI